MQHEAKHMLQRLEMRQMSLSVIETAECQTFKGNSETYI